MPLTNAQKQKRARTKRNAKMAALTEALRWALRELDGRNRYDGDGQAEAAYQRAKKALGNG